MPSTETACVYSVPLTISDEQYVRAVASLSDHEKDRAARFTFDRHRRRWVAGRSALRHILANHLHCSAEEVRFDIRPDGKPVLARPVSSGAFQRVTENIPPGDNERGNDGPAQVTLRPHESTHCDPAAIPITVSAPLYFNMSHSKDMAVVAISFSGEVGCDVEWVKRIRDMDAVCRRFFSPTEQAEIADVAPSEKAAAFYRCWTRKEAVIKTTGEGLRADLVAFDVSLAPGRTAQVYAHRDSSLSHVRWHLLHFEPQENYVAAVAVTGSEATPFIMREYSPKTP